MEKKFIELHVYDAMIVFFIDYYKRTLSGNLRTLMEAIYSLSESSTDQAA